MDFSVILGILGGLGLFIFGIHLMSDSLKKLSLSFLKKILEKATSNRIRSFFVGLVVTSIIQSSSATSVILIGFINAGIFNLIRALPVIIGANIGTTVTAQLIAFKLTKIAPLFVFIGSVIYFFSNKNKNKNKGLAILGFGLLFLGLATMSSAVKPLAGSESMKNLFVLFSTKPLLALLVGIVVTALLQSSSTTIGIVIALASVGLLDLYSSIYLVLGDNIGTCVTALIASAGGKLSSKRLALGHLSFNIIGTVIALPLIPLYLHFIPMLSGDIARQIANTHTIFNIINAMIFLPFIPLFVRFLEKLVPGKDYDKKEIQYLDKNLLNTPPLAIIAVAKELGVMIGICREMFSKTRDFIWHYDHKLINEITIDEESVDDLQKNITEYIVSITRMELSEKSSMLIPSLLHSVNDIERVGDYCENMTKRVERIHEDNIRFSSYAKKELNEIFQITDKLMVLTKKAVENDDHDAARKTLELDLEINHNISESRAKHIKRLEKGICVNEAGLIHSDILTYIERMSAHLCNITQGILHIGKR